MRKYPRRRKEVLTKIATSRAAKKMFEGTNKFLFNGDHVVVRFRDMSFVYIAVLLFYWQHQRVSLQSELYSRRRTPSASVYKSREEWQGND